MKGQVWEVKRARREENSLVGEAGDRMCGEGKARKGREMRRDRRGGTGGKMRAQAPMHAMKVDGRSRKEWRQSTAEGMAPCGPTRSRAAGALP